MQDFTPVAPSDTLTDSREPLLNNDLTAISCSAGTVFPSGYNAVGMLCYREDQKKLYQLKALPGTWTLIADLNQSYVPKSYVDGNFALKDGDYTSLRARSTTKADVGLGTLPNKISDSYSDNSSSSIASSKAVRDLNEVVKLIDGRVTTNTSGISARALLAGNKNQNFSVATLSAKSVVSDGDVTAYSDKRLKTDITPIKNTFERLKELRGVTFLYKDSDTHSIGLVAQDVLRSVPEAVRVDSEGYLSVAYGNLSGLLVEAVKNLNERLEALETYATLQRN
ncbi:hypothetical protein VCR15J2_390140 [Vibrio coralliirubri]|uniref:tail fiber domain-containing protein n=1 Tax=Vibrio coralliirubri TaxID=1516159 RepID=UPI00062FE1BD|nr:tail fiber domain-containing protein [Vibrio coralliirubri]CDT54249.1 hypothetical protein VCR15J2_390140 [Vibrio coralliirubri]